MSVRLRPDLRSSTNSIAYELIEVGGRGRAVDQRHAVTSALGEPVMELPPDRADLPLIIIGYDPQGLASVLFEQRSDPETALRPIAVAGIHQNADAPVVSQLADVLLSPQPDGGQLAQASDTLLNLTRRLLEVEQSEDDEAMRLLQFMESRRQSLDPALDPNSDIAYRYPLAEAILNASLRRVMDVLTDMSQHGVLNRAVVDRVHLCPGPDCSSYRIPVKEICPECHSPDLSMEVSVHHFRCGYMAPESSFRSGEGHMVCPKCDNQLRHIGVEYNRPSEICVCGNCGFWSERPELRAWCVDCNRLFPPEEVRTLRVHRYSLTSDARRAARAGSWDERRQYVSLSETQTPRRRKAGRSGGLAASGSGTDTHSHSRDVIRTLIGISQPTQWPLALYTAEVHLPADTAHEADSPLHQIEQALTQRLDEGDVLTWVGQRQLLLLIPESQQKKAPSLRELKRWIRKGAGDVPFDVQRVDAEQALALLDAEAR